MPAQTTNPTDQAAQRRIEYKARYRAENKAALAEYDRKRGQAYREANPLPVKQPISPEEKLARNRAKAARYRQRHTERIRQQYRDRKALKMEAVQAVSADHLNPFERVFKKHPPKDSAPCPA